MRLSPTSRASVPDEAPLALVEKQRGTMRLAALDGRALALGLAPGMALADARAYLPDLVAVPRNPAADRSWLERIADLCGRYTPMVALDLPDGVTLDITGCVHLFGGEAALAADAAALFARVGLTIRHARAATPEGAWGLARFGPPLGEIEEAEALRRLPIAALRLEPEVETGLRRAGLKRVGDLAGRPTAPVTARFDVSTTLALERLLGRADTRITPRRPPPALAIARHFAEPLLELDAVMAVLTTLAEEAAALLEARGAGGRRFVASLYRSDGAMRALAIETSRPSRDPAALGRLFAGRIETLADPLDPGFGFDLIRLAISELEPLTAVQLRLEGGHAAGEHLAALVDRLSTRLGPERVRCFAPRDTHIPERAERVLPAMRLQATLAWNVPIPGEPPLRPLYLFDPPQPIEVVAELPDSPPALFRWRRALHEVRRYEGPERIAVEWWRGAGDGLTRDYYRVEDMRGRRFWLFRHGLYGTEAAHPRWYLHGLFA